MSQSVVPPSTSLDSPDPSPGRRERLQAFLRREGGWLAAALAVVSATWVVVLIHNPRHFFTGDTEQSYYPWWYIVGEALRHGRLALLDPSQLQFGNHVVDGQLGLYNALTGVIGLGSTVAPNVIVYATAVKFVVTVLGIVGCYVLVRNYRVPPPLAAAAAVAVALCGFTFSLSGARWFDGQLGLALLPWAWWTIRRLVRGRSPFPALVCCYLIVTIGYIYPTLYLIAVLLVCLIEAVLQFGWRRALRVVLIGVFCAFVTVLVYLPAIKTAGFTIRSGTGIVWSGPNRLHWWQLPLLYQPVGTGDPAMFKSTPWAPAEYVVWWLPLLLLVEWRTVRARWRELLPLAVGAVIWPLWAIGPADVGPLRWPARSLEALTLMVAVFVIVCVARGITRRPSTRRIAIVAAFVVVTELLAVIPHHDQLWPRVLSGAVLVVGLVAAGMWVRRDRRLGAVLLAGSLAFAIFTAAVSHPVLRTFRMPADKAAYAHVIGPDARGSILQMDTTVEPKFTAARGRHLLRAALWAMTGQPVINGYTDAAPTALAKQFGKRFNTTPAGLDLLLQREPTTGKRYLDLFGISTLILEQPGRWPRPPAGWHIADRGRWSMMWVRDHPLPVAGGVAWTSPGTSVRTVSEGPLEVSLQVVGVPAGGGSVVLSRIAYPGYSVSGTAGAGLASPLHGYLLRVNIPASAQGKTLIVTFRPPGWHLELACAGLAALLAVGWSGLWMWRRRRVTAADAV